MGYAQIPDGECDGVAARCPRLILSVRLLNEQRGNFPQVVRTVTASAIHVIVPRPRTHSGAMDLDGPHTCA
jgi:hypothetical protein